MDILNFNPIIGLCKKKNQNSRGCTQSIGSELNGKKVVLWGIFLLLRLRLKNITTLGEGGMLYVKDTKLRKKVRGLRHNGHIDLNLKESIIAAQ